MKYLYDELSYQISKLTTKKYSTSFSLGILVLSPKIRPAIYAIYGFVRLADEIVDSFLDYNKNKMLNQFKEETQQALKDEISLNPIINSFQDTVLKYKIDNQLIEQFLHSMEMDLHKIDYNDEKYKEYILGSAEVVGLMCLQVFVEGNKLEYEKLKPFAMKLGSVFQKVNFLRDLKDDYQTLNRTYFPNLEMNNFNNISKKEIEKEIEVEFNEALIGIKMLPISSKFGVYLAYKYYLSLFRKIKNYSAEKIKNERVRIPNTNKAVIMLKSYVRYKVAYL
jgi:phytoene synthase